MGQKAVIFPLTAEVTRFTVIELNIRKDDRGISADPDQTAPKEHRH